MTNRPPKAGGFFDLRMNYPISKRTFFYEHIHPKIERPKIDELPKTGSKHRNRKRYAQLGLVNTSIMHDSLDYPLNNALKFNGRTFYTILSIIERSFFRFT